jgi:hypothetical protein
MPNEVEAARMPSRDPDVVGAVVTAACRTLVLILLVGGPCQPSVARAEDDVREVCPVPGHGGVGLEVPRAWRVTCKPLDKPPGAALSFQPEADSSFDLQVTVVWLQPSQRGGLEAGALRRSLQEVAAQSLPRAVERAAVLEGFRGPEASGYVFTLTDRAPGPGEFVHLTQGSYGVGELQVIFTLLSRDAVSDGKERALRMLREARFLVKQ